jgi:hypothetical protein
MISVPTKRIRLSDRNEAMLRDARKIIRNQRTSPAMMQLQASSRDIARPVEMIAAVKKSVANVQMNSPIARPYRPPAI